MPVSKTSKPAAPPKPNHPVAKAAKPQAPAPAPRPAPSAATANSSDPRLASSFANAAPAPVVTTPPPPLDELDGVGQAAVGEDAGEETSAGPSEVSEPEPVLVTDISSDLQTASVQIANEAWLSVLGRKPQGNDLDTWVKEIWNSLVSNGFAQGGDDDAAIATATKLVTDTLEQSEEFKLRKANGTLPKPGEVEAVDPPDASTADAGALVTAAYQRYLGRAPDEGGANSWTKLVEDLQAKGASTDAINATLEKGFTGSAEYAQRQAQLETERTDLVTTAYETFLKRTPDAGGLESWKDFVRDLQDEGESAENIAKALETEFTKSEEFNRLQAHPELDEASAVAQREAMVTQAYRQFLGREPEPAGLEIWARTARDIKAGGLPDAEVQKQLFALIAGSEEATTRAKRLAASV